VGRKKRRRLVVAGLLAGLVVGGGGLAWRRLHLGGPRTALRRLVTGDPTGIVIHHSATPGQIHGQYVGAALIGRSHQRRGFSVRYKGRVYHIGYHYVIREDGVIEPGRPEHCPGAHAKMHNDYLGICLVGNFSREHNPHFWTPDEPTPAQLQSLLWLCGRLMRKYSIPAERVLRHSDVRETACPGDRFPTLWFERQLVAMSDPRAVQAASRAVGSVKAGKGT
jgi:N-acetylmuramoyl-L-alanine amidase